MAIPTLPRVKRRRGLGNEASDFVKAFLATRKAFADTALAEKRGRLYDAQIARYEEMNAASKERRERIGKGGSGGLSDDAMNKHIVDSLKEGKPQAPAAGGEPTGSQRAAVPDGGYSPPVDPNMAARARGIPMENAPSTEGSQRPSAPPPVVVPPASIRPELLSYEEEQRRAEQQPQALDVYNDAVFEPAPYVTPETPPQYEYTQEVAEGGMIEDTAKLAPLSVALDAALKSVQASYGLGQKGAAVDDGSNAANLEAFQRNENAMSEEELSDILATVNPNSKDKIADALRSVYGFHSGNGDAAAAAEAVGGIIQAARQESMDLGAIALAAIEQRDFKSAGESLIDAYNRVPDGRYVEGNVDERGVGEAIIRDAQTDKVVQRMPLNPQTLQMIAKRFQSGADYYNQLAQFARPTQPARQRTALAYEGGPIEDEETSALDEIDAADREDERAASDILLSDEDTAAPQYQGGSEENEADLPYSGASPVEGRLPEQPIPERKYVPYAPGMSATQRRQVDRINSQLGAEYRRQDAIDRERRSEARADRRSQEARDFSLQRTLYSEARADKRAEQNRLNAAQMQARREQVAAANAEETRRQKDPFYVLQRNLEPYDVEERKQQEREGVLQREANRMSLSGEDYQSSPVAARTGMRKEKDVDMPYSAEARDIARLNVTTRVAPKYEGGDEEKIKKEMAAYARTVKPDQYGYVDATKAIDLKKLDKEVAPNFTSRMYDLAFKITKGNELSEARAAETVFDAVMKQDVAPKATRSDQGWRVTVGNRTVFMNGDTFKELSIIRGQRAQQLKEVAKKAEAAKSKTENERNVELAIRRQRVEEQDTLRDVAERRIEERLGVMISGRQQAIDDARAYEEAMARQAPSSGPSALEQFRAGVRNPTPRYAPAMDQFRNTRPAEPAPSGPSALEQFRAGVRNPTPRYAPAINQFRRRAIPE